MEKYFKVQLKLVGNPLPPVWIPIAAPSKGSAILMMHARTLQAMVDCYCEDIEEIEKEEYRALLFYQMACFT